VLTTINVVIYFLENVSQSRKNDYTYLTNSPYFVDLFCFFPVRMLTSEFSMIIVIQLEVLQTVCELIGSPKAYELSLFEKTLCA